MNTRAAACDQSYLLPSLSCTTGTVSADFLHIIKHVMQWVHYSEHSSKHSPSCVNCVCKPASEWFLWAKPTCRCTHAFAYLTCCNQTEWNTRRQIMGQSIYRIMRLWVCVWLSACMNPPVIVANGLQGGHYTVENICVATVFFFFIT